MSRILIAEDDIHIASFVGKGLRAAGYTTEHVADGETALMMARGGGFDMVVLDIGLPAMDGFTVLRQLRGEGVSTPVVVLTARDSVRDTVAGLEGGANDYMTKPFQFAELLARVRLRLQDDTAGSADNSLTSGDLRLDLRSRRVHVGESVVDLTAREFALLETFLRHPDQVLSREQILGQVWGYDFDPASNVVDVYVRALRAKIGAERVETVRGMGYRVR
ncbi:response regulator transcription factor [Rhodococcus sp. BP-349]|jgi:DNA-binding response OmpR family regulator|uniref:response regulator transcription factor n=1 Tax=unclassified Rhodococcus (in: high G+C Gram-positive bacteria) TaxID=192944 RepID=UPI0006F4130F|nr:MULTISPECIES: response regulator transcription factor [unclassified Rhodococcus (in: high G+C Gram-positive bacteria)]KQU34454.1 two-component system response regulator [Rhodococcus sp. Leaf225]KQU45216.1 two-component system response regulator [Rhodococcus sp. Leaf258]MBY6541367.1 response regulator transcription factor [Rhodococcus sp. BP-363]MBY6544607.1 response regulator transcription factor [Rhodococcus sp. BP-369]MBY6563837.1 response regulator transcription factor [Rhodococcus sp. B